MSKKRNCGTLTRQGIEDDDRLYIPEPWNTYYERKRFIDGFRIYEIIGSKDAPLLFFIHGGGYSALTWAVLAQTLSESIKCHIVAIDLRGHGDTMHGGEDFSMNKLVLDCAVILSDLSNGRENLDLVIIGHSLGGAIATHLASDITVQTTYNVRGLVVLDVVEESAINSLQHMKTFLQSRPAGFDAIRHAIRYFADFKKTRDNDLRAFRVSAAGQLKNCETGICATNDVWEESEYIDINAPALKSGPTRPRPPYDPTWNGGYNVPISDDEDMCNSEAIKRLHNPRAKNYYYEWRMDLKTTAPFWEGWFRGMSKKFLDTQVAKLLILCDIDRLDKTLLIGQMQGAFQLITMKCGHGIQEEKPDELCSHLKCFLVRNKITVELNPPQDHNTTVPPSISGLPSYLRRLSTKP